MGLGLRGDGKRHAVEIDTLFTQGFAMVGNIEHGTVKAVAVALQHGNHIRQDAIGVEYAVVVGVDDIPALAIINPLLIAYRSKFLELFWITLVIGRSMATFLVGYHQQWAGSAFNDLLQAKFQDFIKALPIVADTGNCRIGEILKLYPITDTFAS